MARLECRQRRSPNVSVTFCPAMLVLLLLIGSPSAEGFFSRAAAVVAAPVADVLPPKAAPAPVVAKPPVVAVAPVVAKPPAVAVAPVVAKPPAVAVAPVVAKPPAVAVAPVVAKPPAVAVAPVVAKPPAVAVAPVVAKPPAVAVAPVVAKPPAMAKPPAVAVAPVAKAPVAKAPTALGPALAPVAVTPVAQPPSTGVPLDAAQVKALNALGIKADAEACSVILPTVLTCDRNDTTQHLTKLNAQDCPATATLTEANLAAIGPYLTDLSFMNCALLAPLPKPTDRMTASLTSLTVAGAPVLAGWWIGRMTNLKTLHVQDTYVKVSSGMSVITNQLPILEELTLANTSIGGGIPTDWPSAATLTSIDLSGNQLRGSIPIEITKLPSLTNLDLSNNQLDDHIISGLGNLGGLKTLDLSRNSLRMGIPKTLANLHFLTKLDLSFNKLNGTIPEELVNLPLTYLDLSNNSLTGQIPFDNDFMSKLTTFNVAGNPHLCYNSTITTAKLAGGLRLCGALEPALAPEYYGPALAPEPALDGGDAPSGKKKPNIVVIVFATLGSLVAVAAIVYCCCRYWGAKAGYE